MRGGRGHCAPTSGLPWVLLASDAQDGALASSPKSGLRGGTVRAFLMQTEGMMWPSVLSAPEVTQGEGPAAHAAPGSPQAAVECDAPMATGGGSLH